MFNTLRNSALIVLLVLFLSACGSSLNNQSDAMTELESIADTNGDIDVVLQVEFQPSTQMIPTQLPEADVEWVYFTATTPKGKKLHGLMVPQPESKFLEFTFSDLRLRGNVSKLQGKKVMIGLAASTQSEDKTVGAVILASTTTQWSAPPSTSYAKTEWTYMAFSPSQTEASVFVGKGQEMGAVLGWFAPKASSLNTAMLQKGSGQISVSSIATEISLLGDLFLIKGNALIDDVPFDVTGFNIGMPPTVNQ